LPVVPPSREARFSPSLAKLLPLAGEGAEVDGTSTGGGVDPSTPTLLTSERERGSEYTDPGALPPSFREEVSGIA